MHLNLIPRHISDQLSSPPNPRKLTFAISQQCQTTSPKKLFTKSCWKLSTKSLIKFTIVCKSWQSLIKSSAFIESHLRTTIDSCDQNDSHLLLLSAFSYDRTEQIGHEHHWLRWDSPEFGEHSTLSTPVIYLKNKPVSDLCVIGTSNGLVCLAPNEVRSGRSATLIWNPSIRKVVMLPKPPVSFKSHRKLTTLGFGYDARSNDYKVLRIVSLLDDHSDLSRFATKVQVYSLARGSWNRLSASVTPVDLRAVYKPPTFVNGIFHTLQVRLRVCYRGCYEEPRKCGGQMFICSLHLQCGN